MKKLILVYGPSSSGKSSIKQYLESLALNITLEDEDEAHESYAVELMKEYSRFHYTILQDSMSIHDIFVSVLHGLTPPKLNKTSVNKTVNRQIEACNFFRNHWNDIIKFKDPDVAQNNMFQRIITNVNQGEHGVVFTSNKALFDQYKSFVSKKTQILRIFIYCPLQELCRRIIERNSQVSNPSGARIGLFPIIQFSEYIKKRTNDKLVCVDEISYKALIKYIEGVTASFKQKHPNFNDKKRIINNLGLTDNNVEKIEYTTSFTYDHIINTQLFTPHQSANYISKLFQED